MELAIKIISAILAFIAAAWSYYALNNLIWAVIAFVGAVAIGVIIYALAVKVISDIVKSA